MRFDHLTTSELEHILMEETKKLTLALRDRMPSESRDELRKQIQEIQRLLEERKSQERQFQSPE